MTAPEHHIDHDKIFHALSDKHRRRIIELLHEQDSTLQELSGSFPVSFQALSKHIKVLEDARLLSKQIQGKYRILSLNPAVLKQSIEWMSYYSNFWNEGFDKLDDLIGKRNPGDTPP